MACNGIGHDSPILDVAFGRVVLVTDGAKNSGERKAQNGKYMPKLKIMDWRH